MKISALLVSAVPDGIQIHRERRQSFFRCDIIWWEGTFNPIGMNIANFGSKTLCYYFFSRIHTSFSTHHLGTDQDCIMDKAVGPHLNCYRPWKLSVGGKEIDLI